MEPCTMCKAKFPKQFMRGDRCHKCDDEYGQEDDRDKLLKESNPDLYPAHEYVDVKVYDALVERVVAVEKQLDSALAVVPNEDTPPKRGPGRPKKVGDNDGK